MKASSHKRIRIIGHVANALLITGFILIEFIFDYKPLQYLFYVLISLYLLLFFIRALRGRKTIAFQFELGTQEILKESFDPAKSRFRTRLDLLSQGYPIGFLQSFSREFTKIDKSAQSDPTRLDRIIDFAQFAFPFQNILVAVITNYLHKFTGNRFFKISLSIASDGDYLLHANSQNDGTPPILVSHPTLEGCIDEAAGRIFYELNGKDLCQSYQAFAHYNQALELWSNAHRDKEQSDAKYDSVSKQFNNALKADPHFLLAALYLAAMHSTRSGSTYYFEQSKKHFDQVIDLCKHPETQGSKDTKSKIRGLALALLCNLTNQWLHRIGKFEDEEIAKTYATQNQVKAKEAIKLLGNSPLATHEYAFSLHCMEHIALGTPEQKKQLTQSYTKAVDEYTKAINFALENKEPSALRRSSGNRAYAMIWLAAILRQGPYQALSLSTFSGIPIQRDELVKKLTTHAEEQMNNVAANSKSNFGNYSLANLCLLYSLNSEYGKFIHCALMLSGEESHVKEGDRLKIQPLKTERVRDLNSTHIQYIEGANDISTGLLAACTGSDIPQGERKTWLSKGLEFHTRSLELIKEAEAQNLPSMRIRTLKQMSNLIKLLSHLDSKSNPIASEITLKLRELLNKEKLQTETIHDLTEAWLNGLKNIFNSHMAFAAEAPQ